ncbi:hypothetical protein [Erysipelatoclostridium sp. AM42-17]|uniref:hypothetical protein n=1 Tax=Erysipelatoclostridium sp. AM42-17 TaxID=2293102 RepID=UPI000E48E925|nr:hypothetical protein [Erysipelatoclostridium sp. AM42-17]RHS94481.1 hypothetical protein DW911_04935 [Erysipelatoclostridium sp. AM42-17]
MAASRLLFDFIESLIIVYFIIAYFSLPKIKKNIILYYLAIFLVEVSFDMFGWDGFEITLTHFIINNIVVYSIKRQLKFNDVFVIGLYGTLINMSVLITHIILVKVLAFLSLSSFQIYFCIGLLSKILLFIISFIILKLKKSQISLNDKKYFCVIVSEMTIMITFSLGSYRLVSDDSDKLTLIHMLCGLAIVFLCNIVYMVYLNSLYKEKMDFEKKTQKIYYLEQGVELIKNIHFDTYQTNHRLFYVMKKLKQLAENDHNEDALKIIDQFEHEREMTSKLFSTNNPYFDMIVSIKINELIERHILIKPQISLLPGDKYKDIAFINHIVSILNYIKDNKSITLHIKDQGVYFLVEMYSKEDFYKYDQFLLQHLNLLIKSRYQHENDLYIARFLLGDSDNE